MEVLILGVYLEIFLFRIKWSKIRVRIIHGRALYTGKYSISEKQKTMLKKRIREWEVGSRKLEVRGREVGSLSLAVVINN